MSKAVLLFFMAIITYQLGFTQNIDNSETMAVMTTVVSSQSMDSVPLKISISNEHNDSELTLSPSDKESAGMILTGTPYSSVNLQIPLDQVVANQHGETAHIKDFQLIYGNSEKQTAMDVVPPGFCNELMIPETGRLFIRIGATVTSESGLKGVYTGSVDFKCSTE